MRFFASEYFYLLWALAGVMGLLYWSAQKRKKALKQIADTSLLQGLLRDIFPNAFKWKGIFVIAGLFFAILALARPQWGFYWEEVAQKGNDLFIAIDVSKSMLAEDVKPNRLERAKREMKDLLPLLQGDRVGLIAFAGTAFVLSPLTLDSAALRLFLDDVSPDILPQGGTAIAEAIEKALKSFPQKEKGGKILILITDGEDLKGGAAAAARKAKEEGVQIYTVGIGTPQGAPIPFQDEAGNRGFVKDRKGETVLSKLNIEELAQLGATGVETSVATVYQKYILPMEKKELELTRQKRYQERFQWCLLLALLFFLLEFLVRESRKKRVWFLGLLGLLLIGFSDAEGASASSHVQKGNQFFAKEKWEEAVNQYVQAQTQKPDSAQVQYNLGNALYKQGKFAQASEVYEKGLTLSPEEALRSQILYNLGNAHFRLGKYPEALQRYEQALSLKPEDEDTKYNYELVKKLLEKFKQQQEEQQQQKKDSSDESKKEEGQSEEKKPQESQQKESQRQAEQPKEKEEPKEKQNKEESQKPEQASGEEKKEFTQQEAEALLNALKEEELNTRELRLQQRKGSPVTQPEKDW